MTTPPRQADCPNCGAAQIGRYCATCGQDNRRDGLALLSQIADTFEAVLGFDSRLRCTLRELSRNPGGLVRRYVAGARARYVHPFRYALLTAGLWWLAVALQLPDRSVLSSLPAGQRIMLTYGQLLNLAMLPPLAMAPWLAFLGSRSRYAEHLVLLQFACGHVFLFRAALAGTAFFRPAWGSWLNAIDGWVFTLYLAWALWGWQRPATRRAWPHVLVVLRVLAALVLLSLGSHYVLRAYLWLLLRI
ncbi:MAG TPA: DUF3667 domain-containing protein [Planctomycetota bacterium]|nr:DUF3667 domain-containing protein [Planctomycetota bacterium]